MLRSKNVHLRRFFAGIVLGSIAIASPAYSQAKQPFEVKISNPSAPPKGDTPPSCPSAETVKRVELFYYRNADNIAAILNKLFDKTQGCATVQPLNSPQPGLGVGRGGGNIILLIGKDSYLKKAEKAITALDLPLNGIDLQLWGVQISGSDPNRLAETMSEVRDRIGKTRTALNNTLDLLIGFSRTIELTPATQPTESFNEVVNTLGYSQDFSAALGNSLLEFLVAGSITKDPVAFYNGVYESILQDAKLRFYIEKSTGQSLRDVEGSNRLTLQKFQESGGRLPFQEFFEARGLEIDNINACFNPEISSCWKARNLQGVSLAKITAEYERKLILEFLLYYREFEHNYDSLESDNKLGGLRRTTSDLNARLQEVYSIFQRDIESLFARPTLTAIRDRVSEDRKLSFAQVGRSTISTLNGVKTSISSSSTSAFDVPQERDIEQILARAGTIQNSFGGVIPGDALGQAAAGDIPLASLVGLGIAILEQESSPLEVQTGTNLTFTSGIFRNLRGAELNIDLTVTDPVIMPTETGDRVSPISRIGKQEVKTTVYMQALDFFDLSTFTSQASVDGGHFDIPVIGHVWRAIFGTVPVVGDLFRFPRENQDVFHENLLLTTATIRPTSISLGVLLEPYEQEQNSFCDRAKSLQDYLKKQNFSTQAGKPSRSLEKTVKTCEPKL